MNKNENIKSVFKSGKSTTTKREYTEKLTILINTLEKDKSIYFVKKNEY